MAGKGVAMGSGKDFDDEEEGVAGIGVVQGRRLTGPKDGGRVKGPRGRRALERCGLGMPQPVGESWSGGELDARGVTGPFDAQDPGQRWAGGEEKCSIRREAEESDDGSWAVEDGARAGD